MQRDLPLDAIDARTVLLGYAAVVGPIGIFITGWGQAWLGGPLHGQPWGIDSLTRVTGTVIVAAASCAFGFAQVSDPSERRRALLWFAAAHAIVLLMAWIQLREVWDYAVRPLVSWMFWGLMLAFSWLIGGWLRHGGDIAPFGVYLGLFGTRPPSPTKALKARYEEQMAQAAAQEERHRLARDLHDSIKQQIFAIQTSAAAVEARMGSDPEGARAAIGQVRDSARESMAEMDALLDQLRVTVVENAGLVEALKKQSAALEFRTGAHVVVTIGALPPSGRLRPGVHQALLRTAQEALSNVARHARASSVSVDLSERNNRLVLQITDDGVGYATDQARQGMGLDNIHTRAREFDGIAEITSRPGGGTEPRMMGVLRAGAAGYVRKNAEPETLMAAVRAVARGQTFIDPAVVPAVAAGSDSPREALTSREVDVLRLLALGRSNRDIADVLGIGDETVKSHVSHLIAKLQVDNRAQAIVEAMRRRLVSMEDFS